jgi:hypothetical protein
MKRKIKNLLITTTLLVLLVSCFPNWPTLAEHEQYGAIPPDFGKDTNQVLRFVMIEDPIHDWINGLIKDAAEGYYYGAKQFVSLDELSDEPYREFPNKRFLFGFYSVQGPAIYVNGYQQSNWDYTFYVKDLSDYSVYNTDTSGVDSDRIANYIQALELKRQQYQPVE